MVAARGRPAPDLLNQRFGRLVVVLRASNGSNRNSRWKCSCDCGQEIIVPRYNLLSGNTTSCGCLRREKPNNLRHGHARKTGDSSEYKSWRAMKSRCLNPRDKVYSYYGGRGILVCERWRISFDNFLVDMGLKPSRDYTIDRLNVNGNYEKENCIWATRLEQSLNRRKRG